MNNDLNHSPSPANGRRYWRSLDELADTPEFKEWMHREFPQGASELDGQNRRHFLKIMSASFAFAGVATLAGRVAGGRRKNWNRLASSRRIMFMASRSILPPPCRPALARFRSSSNPTKAGRSRLRATHCFPAATAAPTVTRRLRFWTFTIPTARSSSRMMAKRFRARKRWVSWTSLSKKFAANQGEGLAFLAESSTSPSRARLQKIIAQKFPKSQWFTYDAIDSGIHQRAATQAFGQPVKPVFHFDKAKVILSLDCDFLGGEDDAHNHIRKFAAGRKAGEDMSRLYAVESLFTLTGANADHRLRVAASSIGQIADALVNSWRISQRSISFAGSFGNLSPNDLEI